MAGTDEGRFAKESPFYMGRNEARAFSLDTTPDGGTPASPVNTLWDVTDGGETDVSGTKLSGSTTVSGNVITTKLISGLENGKLYLLEIKWTKGSEIKTALLLIHGRK